MSAVTPVEFSEQLPNGNTIRVGNVVQARLIDGNGSEIVALPITDMTWTVSTVSDTSADDSDKTFTVPANTAWQVLSIWVEFIADATVGSRLLGVNLLDASDDVLAQVVRTGVAQTAGTTRYYLFAPGVADLTAFRDTDYLSKPITSPLLLSAGQKLRVFDRAAIAAAGDDMVVHIQYAEREA